MCLKNVFTFVLYHICNLLILITSIYFSFLILLMCVRVCMCVCVCVCGVCVAVEDATIPFLNSQPRWYPQCALAHFAPSLL